MTQNVEEQNPWRDVSEHPLPKRSVLLVWLESPLLMSRIHTATTTAGTTFFAGGQFSYNVPKVLKWKYAEGPDGLVQLEKTDG